MVPGRQPHDFLTIRNLKNVDPSRIRVEVRHDPDSCLAELESNAPGPSPFYRVESRTANSTPTSTLPAGTFARLLTGLIPQSIAGSDDAENLLRLLRSPDRGIVTKGQLQLANHPEKYLGAIDSILASDSANDRQI